MNVMGHLTSFFFWSNVEQFVVFLENFFSSILLTCFYSGVLGLILSYTMIILWTKMYKWTGVGKK